MVKRVLQWLEEAGDQGAQLLQDLDQANRGVVRTLQALQEECVSGALNYFKALRIAREVAVKSLAGNENKVLSLLSKLRSHMQVNLPGLRHSLVYICSLGDSPPIKGIGSILSSRD
jgi:hypothetical protein